MNEMKCANCGKMLGILQGKVQLKCPRCGYLGTYRSKPGPGNIRKQSSDPPSHRQ